MKYIIILFFLSFTVMADDAVLYDPTVKDDEGLIRVLNLTDHKSELVITQSQRGFNNIAPFSFTDYIIIKQGNQRISIDQKLIDLTIVASNYITVVIQKDQPPTIIQDDKINKKGKSLIALYNFSHTKNVTLKTANGKTSIIDEIKPNSSGYREINAVKIPTAIFDSTVLIKEIETFQLKKDISFNIVMLESGNNIITITAESVVNTRK